MIKNIQIITSFVFAAVAAFVSTKARAYDFNYESTLEIVDINGDGDYYLCAMKQMGGELPSTGSPIYVPKLVTKVSINSTDITSKWNDEDDYYATELVLSNGKDEGGNELTETITGLEIKNIYNTYNYVFPLVKLKNDDEDLTADGLMSKLFSVDDGVVNGITVKITYVEEDANYVEALNYKTETISFCGYLEKLNSVEETDFEGNWGTIYLPFNYAVKPVYLIYNGVPSNAKRKRATTIQPLAVYNVGDSYKYYLSGNISASANSVSLTDAGTDALKAGEGFIIKTYETSYTVNDDEMTPSSCQFRLFEKSDDDAVSTSNNILEGSYEQTSITEYKYYTLGFSEGDSKFGFWKYTGENLSPYRAFFTNSSIEYSGEDGSESAKGFSFFSPVTGIKKAVTIMDDNLPWYTVDGVKLNSKPAAKGLYIHKNKKIIVK